MGNYRINRQIVALLTGTALILLSFQNCGRSGFQTTDESDLMSAGVNGLNPGAASAPVAFDVGLDAIAYNSCVPNSRSAPAYFTVRASAGGTRGGVRLSPDFLTTAANVLKPIQGNAQVLDVQYKDLIEKSNAEAEVQLALRSVTDLRAVFATSANSGVWGAFNYLTDDSWMTPLVESGRRGGNAFVSYAPRAPDNKTRLDFNFAQDFPQPDYWNATLNSQNFRTCTAQGCQNYGQFHLAVGYSEAGNRSVIRSPTAYTTSQTRAYGRAYQLQYGYPNNSPLAGMRVIKGINEYNMATGTPVVEGNGATQWRCTEIPIMSSAQRGNNPALQTSAIDGRYDDYEIGQVVAGVQTDQYPRANRYLCNPMSGALAIQSYNQINLAKLRELLPPNQWQLGYQNVGGVSRLCAIPVGMDCYPNETFPNFQQNGQQMPYPYYVEYDTTQRCINEDNMSTELTRVDSGALNKVCAHYITVCTKQ